MYDVRAGEESYLDKPLREFLDAIASDQPAPGGGSAAAVAVAMAAGLSEMAARVSTAELSDSSELVTRAVALRRRVAPLAQADADTYAQVLDAQRLPRERSTQVRRQEIHSALSAAADVPLAVAEVAAEAAKLAADVAERGNPNLTGDAVTGAFLAGAGARAAALLVKINLGERDPERVGRANDLAEAALTAARYAADLVDRRR